MNLSFSCYRSTNWPNYIKTKLINRVQRYTFFGNKSFCAKKNVSLWLNYSIN